VLFCEGGLAVDRVARAITGLSNGYDDMGKKKWKCALREIRRGGICSPTLVSCGEMLLIRDEVLARDGWGGRSGRRSLLYLKYQRSIRWRAGLGGAVGGRAGDWVMLGRCAVV
jgi:hypothetical protein